MSKRGIAELQDGICRYMGKGVSKAIDNIKNVIGPAIQVGSHSMFLK